jgi:hypothetical protein
MSDEHVKTFLQQYDKQVVAMAMELRHVVVSALPGVTEQVDLPARMIAYCYGQRYIDMVCTIHPSRKGLKLGFYKGIEFPDPEGLLEGTGKISRYVNVINDEQIHSIGIRSLLSYALEAYRKRTEELRKR